MTIQDFGTLQMMRTNEAHFGQGQMVSLTSKVDGAKINTGIDAFSIHQDGASTAITFTAALFRSGKAKFLSQHMEQGFCRIDLDTAQISVYFQLNA